MKDKKIVKIVLIVLLTLIILFFLHVLRNLIILNKITKMQEDNLDNFSCVIEYYYNDDLRTTFEEVYKDGIGVEKVSFNYENAHSWTRWYNNNSREVVHVAQDTITSYVQNYNTLSLIGVPITIKDIIGNNLYKACTSFITYDEINGEKCYVVHSYYGIISTVPYFNVQNGVIEKIIMGNDKLEYKNYKFNSVTEKDIAKPEIN